MNGVEETLLFQDLSCEETVTISGGRRREGLASGSLFSLFNFDTFATTVLVGTVLGIPTNIARIIGFFKAIRQF